MDDAERERHGIEGDLVSHFVQEVWDDRVSGVDLELADESYGGDEPDAQPVIMLPHPVEGLPPEAWVVDISVTLRRWCPPGWMRAPQHRVGEIVMRNGPSHRRWRVVEVLGDDRDPRPGYLVELVVSLDPLDVSELREVALPDEVFTPLPDAPVPSRERH